MDLGQLDDNCQAGAFLHSVFIPFGLWLISFLEEGNIDGNEYGHY